MNRLLRNVFALALMLCSAAAFAGDTYVQARAVTHSCSYYSTQNVEVTLSYVNTGLPWGTSVNLMYGWGGASGAGSTPFDWQNTTTVAAPATAPYTWGTTVTSIIAARSSSQYYANIDFVWQVTLPDGSVFYEKGNSSTYGYYLADFSQLPRPCVSDSSFIGTPQPLTVTTVEKW